MAPTTNVLLVALGFCSVVAGILFSKRRPLFIAFLSVGIVLVISPFVRDRYLTRDAYEWRIVVERTLDRAGDPSVIFIQQIEWITDYERLERRREHVGSVLLNDERTRKVWTARGYIPVAIEARVLYGPDEYGISRNFEGYGPGPYTFTLTFDTDDNARWRIDPLEKGDG